MSNPNNNPNNNDVIELTEIIEEDIMQLPKNKNKSQTNTSVEDDLFLDLELVDNPEPKKTKPNIQDANLDDILNDLDELEIIQNKDKNLAPDLLVEINAATPQLNKQQNAEDDILNSLFEEHKTTTKTQDFNLDDILNIPDLTSDDSNKNVDTKNDSNAFFEADNEQNTPETNQDDTNIILEDLEILPQDLVEHSNEEEIITQPEEKNFISKNTPKDIQSNQLDQSDLFSNLLDTEIKEEHTHTKAKIEIHHNINHHHMKTDEINPKISEEQKNTVLKETIASKDIVEELSEDNPENNIDADDMNTDELDALLDDVIASAPSILPRSQKQENNLNKQEILNFQHFADTLAERMDKLEQTINSHNNANDNQEENILDENSPAFQALLSKLENNISVKIQENIMNELDDKIALSVKQQIELLNNEIDMNKIIESVKESIAEDLERSVAAAAAKVIKEEVMAMLTEE